MEPLISVLIVDDERLARERVLALPAGGSDIAVVGQCATGLAAINAAHPEIVFLDVQTPDLDRLGVVDALDTDDCPELVFGTAYNEYMERALLKALTREEYALTLADGTVLDTGRTFRRAVEGLLDER